MNPQRGQDGGLPKSSLIDSPRRGGGRRGRGSPARVRRVCLLWRVAARQSSAPKNTHGEDGPRTRSAKRALSAPPGSLTRSGSGTREDEADPDAEAKPARAGRDITAVQAGLRIDARGPLRYGVAGLSPGWHNGCGTRLVSVHDGNLLSVRDRSGQLSRHRPLRSSYISTLDPTLPDRVGTLMMRPFPRYTE